MTRILHASDSYRPVLGGIEVFLEDLANRQAEAGHEVTVYTATRGATPGSPGSLVRVRRPRLSRAWILRFAPERSVVATGEYDVVHVHVSVASPFATLVGREAVAAGIPVVVSVHSMWAGYHALVRGIGAIAGWRRWPVAWTAVGSRAAGQVARALPRSRQVGVVPNAVDVGFWRAQPPARVAGRDETVIVSVMRMAARKRPIALLRMLRTLRADLTDGERLRVVLIGDGPLSGVVDSYLERHDMRDWVTMTGRLTRTEIRDIYRGADIYVAPAYLESFGIAALEARCAGLAVVAMRDSGVGEFVADDVSGVLCADDRAMTDALAHLVRDRDRREAILAHNAEVIPPFGWDRVLADFDAAYASAKDLRAAHQRARPIAGSPSRPEG